MATISAGNDLFLARAAQAALLDLGVESHLITDSGAGVDPGLQHASGFRLLVIDADRRTAEEVVRDVAEAASMGEPDPTGVTRVRWRRGVAVVVLALIVGLVVSSILIAV